jgi:hypothetical protein
LAKRTRKNKGDLPDIPDVWSEEKVKSQDAEFQAHLERIRGEQEAAARQSGPMHGQRGANLGGLGTSGPTPAEVTDLGEGNEIADSIRELTAVLRSLTQE